MFGSSSTTRMRTAMPIRPRRPLATRPEPRSRTARPRPGTFSAQTRPPAAASSPRVIDSPIPVPNVDLARHATAVEAFEQVIELAGVEARALIGDRDLEARRRSTRAAHADRPVRWRILRRVLQQVRQRRRHQARIDLDFGIGVGVDANRRGPPARVARVPSRRPRYRPGSPTGDRRRMRPASIRAMSRMSWNSRVSRSISSSAAPRLSRAVVGEQSPPQVLDRDPDRGQRRTQVVAQRGEQRGGEVGLLPDHFGGLALGQKLRTFDRDRHHAGHGIERPDVEPGATAASSADRPWCRAAAARSNRARRRRHHARVAAVGALMRVELQHPARGRERRVRAPPRRSRPLLAALVDLPALIGRQADGHPCQLESPRDVARQRVDGLRPSRRQQHVAASDRTAASPRCAASIASRSRSCAAADRLLAITATMRNAKSATQFCGIGDRERTDGRQEEEVQGQHRHDRDDDGDPETRDVAHRQHHQQQRQRHCRRADVGSIAARPSGPRSPPRCPRRQGRRVRSLDAALIDGDSAASLSSGGESTLRQRLLQGAKAVFAHAGQHAFLPQRQRQGPDVGVAARQRDDVLVEAGKPSSAAEAAARRGCADDGRAFDNP